MCYFMCSAYHLLSYFLGNIYFWWELPIYCLTIPPHSWTRDQYESIKIFLWVCDKIWRGKAFFPLWSWGCKNLGFLESHGVRQSLERTVLDTERSRNERWCACSWACASPTSSLSIISGHKRERCSFMFYFVYASSHWTSDTFKEEFWPIHFLLWSLHVYNYLNIKQIQKISRRMKELDSQTQGSLPQPNSFLTTC